MGWLVVVPVVVPVVALVAAAKTLAAAATVAAFVTFDASVNSLAVSNRPSRIFLMSTLVKSVVGRDENLRGETPLKVSGLNGSSK